MDLDKYIDAEILTKSGFNKFEELTLEAKGNYISCTAYLSHADHEVYKKEINLAVIEAKRQQKDGVHEDYYIGTFNGLYPTEIQEGGELHDYLRDARALIARRNRVSKKDLTAKILEMVSKLREDPISN